MNILLAVIAVLVVAVAYAYNRLISLRVRARNAWADIDVQLKRRHDLVPNLVEAVKGYAAHEKGIFEDVARLRSEAISAPGPSGEGAELQLGSAIRSLFAIAENYPALKADANFRTLQEQLAEVENTIQYARRYYNAVVRDMNTAVQMFPMNIVAAVFGFTTLQYFQVAEDEREPVKVDFGGIQ